MKPFDDSFADKVREVFDHHDEAFDPKAWASFEKRLRGNRKARIIALLSVASKAAAVLLFLVGLTWLSSLLFFTRPSEMADRISPGGEETVFFDEGADPDSLDGLPQQAAVSQIARDGHKGLSSEGSVHLSARSTGIGEVGSITKSEGIVATVPGAGTVTDRVESSLGIPDSVMADQHETAAVLTDSVSVAVVQEAVMADSASVAVVQEVVLTDSAFMVGVTTGPSHEKIAKGMPQGFAVTDDITGSVPGKAEEGGLNWSVTAGSMLTYAEQQLVSGLGFSGGLISQYRVSSLLGLSTGLVLAYQQFDVDGMPLRQRLSRAEYDYLPDQFSARTVGDQSYELLALDIPVNVQLYFQEAARGQWFVSAGFSSLLYLQQNVSGTERAYIEAAYFDAASNTYRTMNYASAVYVESNYDAFTRFDFARLLNLSVGYEIKQAKSVAIIEPFIKYPLAPLSSRNIKMGMGGVTMRLRFGH